MKKIVWVCGIISGLIAGGWMVLFISLNREKLDFEGGMVYGYAAQILAFSLVFVGIKRYRDSLGGYISFGQSFKVGMLIVAISSTLYVAMWLVDYYFVVTDFATQYTACVLAKLKASGASQTAISQKAIEMANFTQKYKNPIFNALVTYTEIVPTGLIAALLAAAIFKKKPKVLAS